MWMPFDRTRKGQFWKSVEDWVEGIWFQDYNTLENVIKESEMRTMRNVQDKRKNVLMKLRKPSNKTN